MAESVSITKPELPAAYASLSGREAELLRGRARDRFGCASRPVSVSVVESSLRFAIDASLDDAFNGEEFVTEFVEKGALNYSNVAQAPIRADKPK